MSFTKEVKNELARFKLNKKCCQIAELAAILRIDGTFHIKGKGSFAIHTIGENAAVARRTYKFLVDLFGLDSEIVAVRGDKLKKVFSYVIYIPPQNSLNEVLRQTGILNDAAMIRDRILSQLVKRNCCAASYLRGAFLGGGAISDPKKESHFEIVVDNKQICLDIEKLFNHFKLNPRVVTRKRNHSVYLKDSESIVRFLALTGAYNSLLEWEDNKILKDVRNYANRMVNCDTANLDRAVRAASSQIEIINKIEEVFGLNNLTDGLKEIAYLRLNNPESDIKELGELCDPPLSKSAVYHRLRRLSKLAEKFDD
ncbi:MAG: DNA-binding protein WhiA [Actinobacteria bacterium]|nr:DNA-binding protein WhiA [Actinomycetota bacterium]